MADLTKATPRPWFIGDYSEPIQNIVCELGRTWAIRANENTYGKFSENAALIVEAVNTYNPNRLALEKARELAQAISNGNECWGSVGPLQWSAMVVKARELLKLLEGK
jgi:hypothetical protein